MASGAELGTITTDIRYIGAALMVAGGVVEILLGVKAEQQTLESIARPLTAEDSADEARPAGATA